MADTVHLVEVPKGLTHGSECDEKFLRKMYQLLLEVDVWRAPHNAQCVHICFPSTGEYAVPQHAVD